MKQHTLGAASKLENRRYLMRQQTKLGGYGETSPDSQDARGTGTSLGQLDKRGLGTRMSKMTNDATRTDSRASNF